MISLQKYFLISNLFLIHPDRPPVGFKIEIGKVVEKPSHRPNVYS